MWIRPRINENFKMYAQEGESKDLETGNVLARIERLENEVEILKSIVYTHVAPKPGLTLNQLKCDARKPCQHNNLNRNSIGAIRFNNPMNAFKEVRTRNPQVQQPNSVTFNPFHMNSFVHPASAITPAVTQPLFADLRNNNGGLFNFVNNITPSEDLEMDLPHKRHACQSFVEVLTCFCPCFSMC